MLSSFVPRRLGSCTLFRRNSSRRALPSTTALHPNSKWPTGVPPAMGEHVMPSGKTAPPSHSTTVATGVPHLFRYHDAETDTRVEVHPSSEALSAAAVATFEDAVRASISAKGSAVVAVSGGSAATRLAGVASSQPPIDWARVHVFLADERCVPEDSPDSNLKSIREAFAAAVKLPKSQLYPIPGSATPQASAEGYEKTLRALPEAVLPRDSNGMPIFDVVVLGMGPDTHTASLFPNAPTLAPTHRAFLGVANSPKPPPARVTLSLSAINAARLVLFVVGGADKAEALQRVLEVQALPGALPAQAVRPAAGALRWLIDASAAAQLNTAAWDKPAAWPRSQVPSPSKV